jgi:tRNA dimethylallyltransferase
MNNFLIVVLGPTGVGKSDLSVEIAYHFNADIISADSRQLYAEMKIGTAVPSEIQLKRVRHHFIRFLSVKDYFSASLFERAVLELLPSLFKENNIVVMTGGSGLYIDAVCRGIDDIPDIDFYAGKIQRNSGKGLKSRGGANKDQIIMPESTSGIVRGSSGH